MSPWISAGSGSATRPLSSHAGTSAAARDARRWLPAQQLLDVLRGAVAPHQPFQQRCGCQPVGAVQPGATDLAHRVQILDAGAAPLVHRDAAARVVRGRHHRDRLLGDVDADLQAFGVDVREARRDGVGRHVRREIEQDVRVAVRLHLMMDGAGDHIARGQVLPVGRIFGHERPAIGREQHAALAAHRLADQEAFGARARPTRSG